MSEQTRGVEHALIVAGGRGTRLRPLTNDVAKPLLPFCGIPFLAGVMRRLADAGVTQVHLVVGVDPSPFALLEPFASEMGVSLHYVPEPTPLDTAGGVRAVAADFDGPFLVLNGDVLTDVDFAAVVEGHLNAEADATIVLTRVEDTSTFGVAVRDGTRITRFVEKPAPGTLPDHDAINAGTYVLEPHVFAPYGDGPLSFERAVFPDLLERGGHIEGVVWEGVWADLGTPERYLDGHKMALDGDLAWPSVTEVADRGDGVRVAAGAQVDDTAELVGPVLILDGARVEAGATVGPHVVLGVGAAVGEGAEVRDSVLHAAATIGQGVRAVGLLAGPQAVVEPGATIGERVVIGTGSVVGSGYVVADDARIPEPPA